MLDVLNTCSSPEGPESRFVAVQQNDARNSFGKDNTLRIEKDLAVIERKIKGDKEKTE
jgi:hypothetical protein